AVLTTVSTQPLFCCGSDRCRFSQIFVWDGHCRQSRYNELWTDTLVCAMFVTGSRPENTADQPQEEQYDGRRTA
ncbi:hypothetical protein, partial [Faecalibaculum rodentium]|uniref:hypothetical protein n=1 Tax=Faecalibaculum rodentium TaxID=1702221 RepID=UPI00263B2730